MIWWWFLSSPRRKHIKQRKTDGNVFPILLTLLVWISLKNNTFPRLVTCTADIHCVSVPITPEKLRQKKEEEHMYEQVSNYQADFMTCHTSKDSGKVLFLLWSWKLELANVSYSVSLCWVRGCYCLYSMCFQGYSCAGSVSKHQMGTSDSLNFIWGHFTVLFLCFRSELRA